MQIVFSEIFAGLSIASILLLIALGLAIIYGSMGVINLAHGEFVMLGAYGTWALQTFLGIGPIYGLLPVFFIVAIIGWCVERGVVRHLYHRPLDTILATWGIGIMLQQVVRLTAGAELRYVKMPENLGSSLEIAGVALSSYRLIMIIVSCLLLFVTWFIFHRTEFGMKIRAVMQNKEMAECCGINSEKVYGLTFAYGAGLAGVAGALVSALKSVSPEMGTNFVVDAFMVVVVGGVGSLLGTAGSSLILGEINAGVSFLLNDTLGKAIVFLAVVVMIRFRPHGLFFKKQRV